MDYVIIETHFSKAEWVMNAIMNPDHFTIRTFGDGHDEQDCSFLLSQHIAHQISDQQWNKTIGHRFTMPRWTEPASGIMYKGLGGLRDQYLRIKFFNHFHMTVSIGAGYETPSDHMIMHLITFYDVALFILLGAYHRSGPAIFAVKFIQVLKDKRIGKHRVTDGWIRISTDARCGRFMKSLQMELARLRDMPTIQYYCSLKDALKED